MGSSAIRGCLYFALPICQRMPQSEPSSSTSLSLIGRVRQQQPEAWARFTHLYGPLVYRWTRRTGLQHADIVDVVQEVFRAVAVSIDRYDRDQGTGFRGWLWGITRNKVRDFQRACATSPVAAGGTDAMRRLAAAADVGLDDGDDEADPESSEQLLLHRALELIRAEVEPHTWQAFWRLAVESHPVAEISRDLNMTGKAVRQAKYRVLRRLRTELDGQFEWLASTSD
jgi:RNA polymerase sigma-70 factor (ECF subfamily)